MMMPHPTKIKLLILLIFVVFFQISCEKDSDLFLEAVLIPENPVDIENVTSNDSLISKTIELSPINDAYVQEGKGYDDKIIRVRSTDRTSYLMFDLSSIEGELETIDLKLTIDADAGDGTLKVHKASHSEWSEDKLSASTAPDKENELGNISKVYNQGATEKINIKKDLISNEMISFVLTQENGNDFSIASKESPNANGPKLVVTYKSSEKGQSTSPDQEPGTEETQNTTTTAAAGGFFVTVDGKATNDGLSEDTAWSIQHAFSIAKAGDIVYIKAGNYGNVQLRADNSGTSDNHIKFIGYTNTPGDLVSNQGSTFKYGENLNPNKMPLLSSSNGTGIQIDKNFVEIENIQITGYNSGVKISGYNVVLRNIVATQLGTQSQYNAYDGWGIIVTGNYALIENCFILNATAESIKLYDSDYSRVNYCEVRADNNSNPTDYYFLLTGGTNNSIIENSYAERTPGLQHGGHGFDMKDLAENNIFRNCKTKGTSFELNFSGVRYNTIENCSIIGLNTSSNEWHSRMVIFNGANNNLIKNMDIQNTWTAINWADYDDGYVGPGGDRDEASCGYDNSFDNITVNNTNRVLNVGEGVNFNAWAKRNTIKNSTFSNFENVAVTYLPTEDIKFQNCKFSNGKKLVTEAGGVYAPYSKFNVKWENCTWSNVDFTPPN